VIQKSDMLILGEVRLNNVTNKMLVENNVLNENGRQCYVTLQFNTKRTSPL